jgi:hypothetical protein
MNFSIPAVGSIQREIENLLSYIEEDLKFLSYRSKDIKNKLGGRQLLFLESEEERYNMDLSLFSKTLCMNWEWSSFRFHFDKNQACMHNLCKIYDSQSRLKVSDVYESHVKEELNNLDQLAFELLNCLMKYHKGLKWMPDVLGSYSCYESVGCNYYPICNLSTESSSKFKFTMYNSLFYVPMESIGCREAPSEYIGWISPSPLVSQVYQSLQSLHQS